VPTPQAVTYTPIPTPEVPVSVGSAVPVYPSPYSSSTPYAGPTVLVSGTVYNELGAAVQDAVVSVQSLDATVPYAAYSRTTGGAYAFNNVPEGIILEVTASKDGFTRRTRVKAFGKSPTGNVFNFGGPEADGRAHFISGGSVP
jgi:hypothetical protein